MIRRASRGRSEGKRSERRRSGGRRIGRAGFTLIEMVIVLAVITVLGAVLVATLARRPSDAQAAALSRTFDALSDGVLAYRTDVRRYPPELGHLSTRPPAGTTDLCGRPLPAHFRAAWQGPYVGRVFTAAGLPVDDATVQNDLETEPASLSPGASGLLIVVASDVDSTVAADLEADYDPGVDLSAGTIRWTATGAGQGTLRYAIPITGC